MNRGDEYFKKAEMYQNGYECEEDIDKAIYYYKLAAEFGRSDAYFEIGYIYACDEKYLESLPYFEIAYKNGVADAYVELLNAYYQLGEWEKYISFFLKKAHSEKENKEAIKAIDNYSKKLIDSMDKKEFDIELEFKKITSWACALNCSHSLKTRLYKLREDILSNCIYQKIELANSVEQLNSLFDMLKKCKNLIANNAIVSDFYTKLANLEIKQLDVSSYKDLVAKYEGYPTIQNLIVLNVAESYLYGSSGVNQDPEKAISIVYDQLASSEKAQYFYSKVLDYIEELVKEHNYEKAVFLLNKLPTNRLARKNEITHQIEVERIKCLRQSNDPNKKIELARILLSSANKTIQERAEGLEIINNLFLNQNNETAFSMLLNESKNDEHAIYRLCSTAIEKGMKIDDQYMAIYQKVEVEEKQRSISRELIKQEIERRGIKYLVHFTNRDNLDSIMKNGILSRHALNSSGIVYSPTDSDRFDYMMDYISTSITKPNFSMLNSVLKENRISNPIVLFLNPKIMYDPRFEVMFYVTNAATRKMRHRSGSDFKSFTDMFADNLLIETNDDCRVLYRFSKPNNETTDWQAEVMVKDRIPPDYIEKITLYINGVLVDYPLKRMYNQ